MGDLFVMSKLHSHIVLAVPHMSFKRGGIVLSVDNGFSSVCFGFGRTNREKN